MCFIIYPINKLVAIFFQSCRKQLTPSDGRVYDVSSF